MIVFDIETTGVNAQKHSIISIGAVDMDHADEEKGRFYLECRIWDGAHIEADSMVVNGMTEEQVKDPSKPEEGEAVRQFFAWLAGRESLVLAGHNPMFDLSFLQAAAARHHVDFPIAHRSLDLHTICYVHMVQKGEIVPIKNKKSDLNSDAVMKYVGIPSEPKPHIAINGAVWEAEALSRLIFNKNLLEQFAQYPIPWV
jgi:DNA polymerase III epsilon subunit-like protein